MIKYQIFDDYISDITFKARIAWCSHSSVILLVGHGVDGRRGLPDKMKKMKHVALDVCP